MKKMPLLLFAALFIAAAVPFTSQAMLWQYTGTGIGTLSNSNIQLNILGTMLVDDQLDMAIYGYWIPDYSFTLDGITQLAGEGGTIVQATSFLDSSGDCNSSNANDFNIIGRPGPNEYWQTEGTAIFLHSDGSRYNCEEHLPSQLQLPPIFLIDTVFDHFVNDILVESISSKDLYLSRGDAAPPIPEPATILLVGCGLLFIAGFGRKRLKAKGAQHQ